MVLVASIGHEKCIAHSAVAREEEHATRLEEWHSEYALSTALLLGHNSDSRAKAYKHMTLGDAHCLSDHNLVQH
jgi:hypothetical protein